MMELLTVMLKCALAYVFSHFLALAFPAISLAVELQCYTLHAFYIFCFHSSW